MSEQYNPEEAKKTIELATNWLLEHKQETMQTRSDVADALTFIAQNALPNSPVALILVPVIGLSMTGAFELGYYLGRTHQDVPKIFKEAFDK